MPIDGSGAYTRTNGSYSGTNLWQQRAAQPSPKIDAAEHDAEMNDVADALSACLKANGSKVPTANLPMGNFKHTGCANAVNADEYATLGQITGLIPAGIIVPYAGGAAPTGWLLCDGSAISRSGYGALYTVIGTTYGVGDGSTTFNVPNMKQRFPLGKADSGTGATLGGTGGAIDHVHTGPSHTHSAGTNMIAKIGALNSAQTRGLLYQPNGIHTFDPNGGYAFYDNLNPSVTDITNPWGFGAGGNGNSDTVTGLGTNAYGAVVAGDTTASGTGNTGTANPPYLVLNFIIKY